MIESSLTFIILNVVMSRLFYAAIFLRPIFLPQKLITNQKWAACGQTL